MADEEGQSAPVAQEEEQKQDEIVAEPVKEGEGETQEQKVEETETKAEETPKEGEPEKAETEATTEQVGTTEETPQNVNENAGGVTEEGKKEEQQEESNTDAPTEQTAPETTEGAGEEGQIQKETSEIEQESKPAPTEKEEETAQETVAEDGEEKMVPVFTTDTSMDGEQQKPSEVSEQAPTEAPKEASTTEAPKEAPITEAPEEAPPTEASKEPTQTEISQQQSETAGPTEATVQSPRTVTREKTLSPPPPTETMGTMSTQQEPPRESNLIPDAPKIPVIEREPSQIEGTMSNTALNVVWSFGLNRNIPVKNLTDNNRKLIMYACAHVGVLYDYEANRQHILQGHANPLTCTCISEDKRWLATGDKGKDSMVIIWDTYTGVPVQTIFDDDQEGGVVAMAMTPDARYLATLSSAKKQILAIWDWTVDGENPMCTAELKPNYGVQNFIKFNEEDIHYLVTNSDSQVVFFHWSDKHMEYFAPPLTDQDFNKPVGRYSQSIFQRNSSRVYSGTSIGNLVVWDNNKPVTKLKSMELSANKKALKIIRLQDRGINVLQTTEKYIVVGDMAGHVKFFDESLKLVHWYQDFDLGPITSVSFAYNTDFQAVAKEGTNYPPDATIEAKKFVIKDFVVGSSIAIVGSITADGTKVKVIHREHDAAIHALTAHPRQPYIVIGSYSGLLKIWDYEKKQVMVTRTFERGNLIRCCSYDPKGAYIAVGFVNGSVRILDSITLSDEIAEPFRYARDAITHIAFSHDSKFLATADAEFTMTLYRRQRGDGDPYMYLGRYRAHYKPIKDIMFGVHLDTDQPRLLSLGMDRVLVEYDLENSEQDNIRISSTDRIEQSAVPQCMAWYPPITKEHFIVTANDQFKFKLYNATTKMCRKTLLGPTYGSPIQKLSVLPTKDPARDKRYVVYITKYKVGLHILPLDGNPHNAMALIAHPAEVANMACSHDGKYIFTTGGTDSTVHMWEINLKALEAQSNLGGEDLVPFYGLLEGGREGELFAELEDYFYYAQIRNKGVNDMGRREITTKIPLSEVPFVMRAMGFYPSEQEIEDMLNEVKFSRYVETGQYVDSIDLGEFIKLYTNHRPAFGLDPEKLIEAFDILGVATHKGSAIERGDLLDYLQTKGEHMTEYELAEYLTTLLGFNAEGGSSELQEFDSTQAGDVIDQNLPHQINADMFSKEVLGFSMYNETPQSEM
ncbi:cilia- and flagella-associated protein 251-like isoform X1 [Pecten maximus]|uniref:cilia- and flagella-associated protein 251-like isoform X1 n=1 Tax=Pecten maximus TaxID=6579 RepID=UPI001458BC86|nr:cilia- and flagella-associated protein 251-like isoform X1 [Pecten maximus]XP_033747235.1 cilia- and flagella-associated protein 251-like isoform X1 [Pecten maximus]